MDNLKQYHTLLNRLLLAQMYRTEAYRKASEATSDPYLKQFFVENTRTGERLIEEISLAIHPLYISETEDTAIPTQYQRIWTMLPEFVFGAGKNVVLDKYMEGESMSIHLYTEALTSTATFPVSVREMLLRQRAIVFRVYEKARQLKVSRLNIILRRIGQIRRFFFQKRVLFQ